MLDMSHRRNALLILDIDEQIIFARGIVKHSKYAKSTYRIQLTNIRGVTYNLRFNFDKLANRGLKVMLARLIIYHLKFFKIHK